MRNTKVVATLGPATDSRESVKALVEAGVDVFRLNASHGTPEEHRARIVWVRDVARELGAQVGVLLDLQGPKIRLGVFEGGGCVLTAGSRFAITVEQVLGNAQRASINYARFADDVKPGDRVLIADGAVELRVLSTDGADVACEVLRGGAIGDRKGVNLPGVKVSSPALTRKDMTDLRSGLEAGIDLVALSFVRRRDDLLRLRLFLEEQDASLPIVAKIEKPEAWDNIDPILEESDGVMVARGDLGVEVALERVPGIQKAVIDRARRRGRFVITATQMLESMVHNAVPTRAEVSDIANAIYDGTDAVMLSAETSTGKHPVEAARWMARIAEEAERASRNPDAEHLPHGPDPSPAEIVADAAYRAANAAQPAAIVTLTASGTTARLVSRYRPHVPVFAFTLSDKTAGQLSVVYGIRPVHVPLLASTDDLLAEVDRLLQSEVRLKRGDRVILLAGLPLNKLPPANVMMLHRVGEMR
ncbi:MAG: pyruvate kinase [Bryobacteraceae bacterium]|nr:pyruvate kinase [Bryobacteraceae bacterium]